MNTDWTLIEVIVEEGYSEDIMAAARKAGAPGGTVCLAKGTASNTILAALGIGDTKQEVITSVIRKEDAENILNAVKSVKAKGVAMIIDTARGNRMEAADMNSEWVLIEIICEDGYSEDIMATARKAGAEGGTVINAHGTSTEDDVKFFLLYLPRQTPISSAARTISLSGSTSLYLPAMSGRALKVMRFPLTATLTPNFPSAARRAA